MTEEIDPRHAPEQTYPTESGAEHPPAAEFPAASPGQSANVPDALQGPAAPEQYGGRPEEIMPSAATAPEHGDRRPYSAQDSERTRGGPGDHPGAPNGSAEDRASAMGVAAEHADHAGGFDPSVRNEKQLVADSHAERPDENLGQRFEWQGGRPTAAAPPYPGELQQEARGGRWKRAAVALAGVSLGAFLLNRRRRRG